MRHTLASLGPGARIPNSEEPGRKWLSKKTSATSQGICITGRTAKGVLGVRQPYGISLVPSRDWVAWSYHGSSGAGRCLLHELTSSNPFRVARGELLEPVALTLVSPIAPRDLSIVICTAVFPAVPCSALPDPTLPCDCFRLCFP